MATPVFRQPEQSTGSPIAFFRLTITYVYWILIYLYLISCHSLLYTPKQGPLSRNIYQNVSKYFIFGDTSQKL